MYEIGQEVYFKRDTDKRTRRGVVIAGNDAAGYQVQGRRSADKFNAEIVFLTADQMQSEQEFKASRAKSGLFEAISAKGRQITSEEMKRRSEAGTLRLGMTETQVLQARAMLEIRRRVLLSLAASNRITPRSTDFEFEELTSEYLLATLGALRTATSKAADADLEAFRAHLTGKADYSRIMMNIARTGKTAAIRYLKKRQEYHQHHHNIDDYAYQLAA